MNIESVSAGAESINIQDLLAGADKSTSDARKDSKIMRQLHHAKSERALDQNIAALQKQADQMGKSGMLNFVVGLVTNLVAVAAQVLSVIFPGVGAMVATLVNKVVQTVGQAIQTKDPYAKEARQEGINAESYKKEAATASHQSGIEDEFIKQLEGSGQTTRNRMEKAFEDLLKAKDAAVRG